MSAAAPPVDTSPMDMQAEKKCRSCGRTKPEDAFMHPTKHKLGKTCADCIERRSCNTTTVAGLEVQVRIEEVERLLQDHGIRLNKIEERLDLTDSERDGADVAEWFERLDPGENVEAGDLVELVDSKISRQLTGGGKLFVVSTNPIITCNSPKDAALRSSGRALAFIGQVPVKVRGPVIANQPLGPSGFDDGTAVATDAPTGITVLNVISADSSEGGGGGGGGGGYRLVNALINAGGAAVPASLAYSPAAHEGSKKPSHYHLAPAVGTAVGAVAGGVCAAPVAMGAVGAMGFTANGIAAGSAAAGMMAAEAVVAGGGVAAGGTVATLQGIGAAGLGAGLAGFVAVAGMASVGGIGLLTGTLIAVSDPYKGHPGRASSVQAGIGRRAWCVVTEELWFNVQCYVFGSREDAEEHFSGAPIMLARVLYGPEIHEVKAGGWNGWANDTIRRYVNDAKVRTTTIASHQKFKIVQNYNTLPGQDVEMMRLDGDLCKALRRCEERGYGGFVYWHGTAFFRKQSADECDQCKVRLDRAILYLNCSE